MKPTTKATTTAATKLVKEPTEAGFSEVVQLIASARQRAIQVVNTSLIDLYWQVGEIISRKIAAAEWGDGVVQQLADHISQTKSSSP